MLRDTGYSSTATNNSLNAGGGSDISHEAMHWQWFVGSRRKSQGGGGGNHCEGNARSRIMTYFWLIMFLRRIFSVWTLVFFIYMSSLRKTETDALK